MNPLPMLLPCYLIQNLHRVGTMESFRFLTTFLALFIFIRSAEATSKEAYLPARDINELSELMPISALPWPKSLKLKYIVLGIGTQNYTCKGREENSSPTALGAVGKLSNTI